jgi:hypothetical protein
MLDVMDIGKEHEAATGNEAAMESNIVDAMDRYFGGKTGRARDDMEYAIVNSILRYFEERNGGQDRE